MSRKSGRLLTAALAAGLVLSLGSAALAAPVGGLKQFKVPTANSDPRAITNGSDGNRWFTESDQNVTFAKVARITPGGTITEFDANCGGCNLSDIVEGPDGILYVTTNDPVLLRFDLATQAFLPPRAIPNTTDAMDNVAVHGDEIWFDDFNNDALWRYDIGDDAFTEFPLTIEPSDVVVDSAGDAWFPTPNDHLISRLDRDTGTVTSFLAPNGLSPGEITIATDGQIWFTSRFATQGVGSFDPVSEEMTTVLIADTGPQGIAPGPSGSVWFAQELAGNVARITNAGVITEGKAVKGSGPFGIVVAPNGDPWYTMRAANKVATLQLR